MVSDEDIIQCRGSCDVAVPHKLMSFPVEPQSLHPVALLSNPGRFYAFLRDYGETCIGLCGRA